MPDPATTAKLIESLHHRGPDAHGHFTHDNTMVLSTRLAIVDVEHGDQPLFSPNGLVLVANGEIYNAPELRAHYKDYPFKTHSDCEVIFPLYEEFGLQFSDRLRGMFAVALLDPASGRLILSRDPFGIKPLYYAASDGRFSFASEIGALLDTGAAERTIETAADAELLQLKYITGQKTIFQSVQRVCAGETLVVEDAVIREQRTAPLWPPTPPKETRRQTPFAKHQAQIDAFTNAITDSVAVHLRADVPWCLYYSGGVDSTILMRVAKKVAGSVNALTIGYAGAEEEDESHNAMKLAEASGVSCHRVEMGADDFWTHAPRIAAASDDPMTDPAIVPLYFLAKATAERKYKVSLSGEGADEIFGGYSRYRRAILPKFRSSLAIRRGVFSRLDMAGRFGDWYTDMNAIRAEQERDWPTRGAALQAVDILERLPNCLLIKLDRALMIHGVEGRTPFLDRAILDMAAGVPDRLKVSLRFGKRLLRDWLAADFPFAKPYEKKRGFSVPLGSWIYPRRDTVAKLVAAQPGVARWFKPDEVQSVMAMSKEDEQPAWALLFYALWHAHHVQSVPCGGDIEAVLSESARMQA